MSRSDRGERGSEVDSSRKGARAGPGLGLRSQEIVARRPDVNPSSFPSAA